MNFKRTRSQRGCHFFGGEGACILRSQRFIKSSAVKILSDYLNICTIGLKGQRNENKYFEFLLVSILMSTVLILKYFK